MTLSREGLSALAPSPTLETEMNFLGVLISLWCAVAMVAHIWACVATNWSAMLILGLVFFPVGVVHGTGVIFGAW